MKKIMIICFITLALINLTCQKDKNLKCTDANTVKLVPHAVDFFYFKQGSWWVYICKQKGLRDSVWVSENSISAINSIKAKKDCNCGWGKCYEDATVKILSTTSKRISRSDFLYYRLAYSVIDPNGNGSLFEVRESFDLYDNHFPGYKLSYDGVKNFTPKSGHGATIENYDSLTINNVQYKDIMKYYYPNDKNPPDWFYEAYYAKNIHLLQYRLHSDSSLWELEKYNIVK